MKTIELTQGRVAIVDDSDFEWLNQWKWCYVRPNRHHTYYACRNVKGVGQVSMHVEIMKHHEQWVPDCQVDHRNDCGIDNRKENLRIATAVENGRNRRCQRSSTSGHTGVSWNGKQQKWEAYIHVCGKKLRLGNFQGLQDAIDCRRAAEIKFFGEFAHDPLNLCPGRISFCPDCSVRLAELLPKGPVVDWDALT